MMKPNPSPEEIFYGPISKLDKAKRIGQSMLNGWDEMVGGRGYRASLSRSRERNGQRTDERVLGFVNSQKKALEGSPAGLEFTAPAREGKTINAYAEGNDESRKGTRWVVRVIDDKTRQETDFYLETLSRPESIYDTAQNEVGQPQIVDSETGVGYAGIDYNQKGAMDLQDSVGMAFAALSVAARKGTLQVSELPAAQETALAA